MLPFFRRQLELISFALLLACTSGHKQINHQLGEIVFTVNGKKEAMPYFEKGLLLLHSFEYEDAAESFKKARELDPSFAMAYWGEAMTHNHILWQYLNFDKANEVLLLLGNTPEERVAKAKTELEKGFIKAVNALYSKGKLAEVYNRYSGLLGELYKKYPGNNEVATFYSLSLIASATEGRDIEVYEKAAQVAKEVLQRAPKHPGALHYLIHAYDDPDHAGLALTAADKYSVVAPEAGHALHMPTHIYLALGMWDKVVSSNIDSWQASVNRKARKGLDNKALNYHSFYWLAYGYMQQGKLEKAKKMVEEMKAYCTQLPTASARSYFAHLQTAFAVTTNDFKNSTAGSDFNDDDLNISTRAVNHFHKGMEAFYKGGALQLDSIISKMTAERLVDKERAVGGIGVCGNVNSEKPTMLDVHQAEVMELQLKAMKERLIGTETAQEKFLKEAVALESSISYSFGPPVIIKPSWELYGEWLLEKGRAKEALSQFERSLKAAPNRTLSMTGKAKAMKMVG